MSLDYIGLSDEAVAHGADPTATVLAATAGYELVATGTMRDGYHELVYVRPVHAAAVAAPVRA